MPAGPLVSRPDSHTDIRGLTVLACLGAWTAGLPYTGRVLGLEVDVASRIELVDHVLPGALIAVVAAAMALRALRSGLTENLLLAGGGVCLLAAFWVLATHVPLISDTAHAGTGWPSASWHVSTSPLMILLSAWLVLRPRPKAEGRASARPRRSG